MTPGQLEMIEREGVVIEFDADSHTYKANGESVDGVTSIINNVVPKELQWWGMTEGIKAVAQLYDLGDWRRVLEAVKLAKLTVNDKRDGAATRGKSVHKALEDYAEKGTVPIPAQYPESEAGYIVGLANFLIDAQPEFEASERKVAHPELGYAGTLDLVVKMAKAMLPVRKRKNGEVVREEFDGRGVVDLKTSKRVYPLSHYPQLAAYDAGYVRMGGEPTDWQAVLHLPGDGTYWMHRSTATIEDFVAYKGAFDAQYRIKPKRGRS